MQLTSPTNPKIKFVRSLHLKKSRDQEQRFLVEGEVLVKEAIAAGFIPTLLLYTSGLHDPQLPILAAEAFAVSEAVMAKATTLSSPPTALAVCVPQAVPIRAGSWPCQLIAGGVQDPGNFGALVRLADAMHLQGVRALSQTVDPFHPKVVRGSMGSCLRTPIFQQADQLALAQLQAEGFTLVAAVANGEYTSFNYTFPERCALILGSEGQGIEAELLARADVRLAIPIRPGVDSLNVSTAAAMLVHEYVRQQEALR
jgi:TrmH family RNA methyltransferase